MFGHRFFHLAPFRRMENDVPAATTYGLLCRRWRCRRCCCIVRHFSLRRAHGVVARARVFLSARDDVLLGALGAVFVAVAAAFIGSAAQRATASTTIRSIVIGVAAAVVITNVLVIVFAIILNATAIDAVILRV